MKNKSFHFLMILSILFIANCSKPTESDKSDTPEWGLPDIKIAKVN